MSENNVPSSVNESDIVELMKKQQEQMESLREALDKSKKSQDTMLKRLTSLEKTGADGAGIEPLIAFDNFENEIEKSRRAIYMPNKLTSFSNPARMSVKYKPSEEVVEKVFVVLDDKFKFKRKGKNPASYEKLVNELVAKHGLASELREVTKKMNLYKVSSLRKAIYAKAYAWALFELFDKYEDQIKTMVEDAYGFSQKVISHLETDKDGPIKVFSDAAVQLTLSRNGLCAKDDLEKQLSLSLREKI